eukprot:g20469.t1
MRVFHLLQSCVLLLHGLAQPLLPEVLLDPELFRKHLVHDPGAALLESKILPDLPDISVSGQAFGLLRSTPSEAAPPFHLSSSIFEIGGTWSARKAGGKDWSDMTGLICVTSDSSCKHDEYFAPGFTIESQSVELQLQQAEADQSDLINFGLFEEVIRGETVRLYFFFTRLAPFGSSSDGAESLSHSYLLELNQRHVERTSLGEKAARLERRREAGDLLLELSGEDRDKGTFQLTLRVWTCPASSACSWSPPTTLTEQQGAARSNTEDFSAAHGSNSEHLGALLDTVVFERSFVEELQCASSRGSSCHKPADPPLCGTFRDAAKVQVRAGMFVEAGVDFSALSSLACWDFVSATVMSRTGEELRDIIGPSTQSHLSTCACLRDDVGEGRWTEWSACSEPCGGGQREKYQVGCTPKSLYRSKKQEACNLQPCPSCWKHFDCQKSGFLSVLEDRLCPAGNVNLCSVTVCCQAHCGSFTCPSQQVPIPDVRPESVRCQSSVCEAAECCRLLCSALQECPPGFELDSSLPCRGGSPDSCHVDQCCLPSLHCDTHDCNASFAKAPLPNSAETVCPKRQCIDELCCVDTCESVNCGPLTGSWRREASIIDARLPCPSGQCTKEHCCVPSCPEDFECPPGQHLSPSFASVLCPHEPACNSERCCLVDTCTAAILTPHAAKPQSVDCGPRGKLVVGAADKACGVACGRHECCELRKDLCSNVDCPNGWVKKEGADDIQCPGDCVARDCCHPTCGTIYNKCPGCWKIDQDRVNAPCAFLSDGSICPSNDCCIPPNCGDHFDGDCPLDWLPARTGAAAKELQCTGSACDCSYLECCNPTCQTVVCDYLIQTHRPEQLPCQYPGHERLNEVAGRICNKDSCCWPNCNSVLCPVDTRQNQDKGRDPCEGGVCSVDKCCLSTCARGPFECPQGTNLFSNPQAIVCDEGGCTTEKCCEPEVCLDIKLCKYGTDCIPLPDLEVHVTCRVDSEFLPALDEKQTSDSNGEVQVKCIHKGAACLIAVQDEMTNVYLDQETDECPCTEGSVVPGRPWYVTDQLEVGARIDLAQGRVVVFYLRVDEPQVHR